MNIRAKFVCERVTRYPSEGEKVQEDVSLRSVWTPGGNLTMSISNPSAWGAFEVGKEYFLDFSPALAAALFPAGQ